VLTWAQKVSDYLAQTAIRPGVGITFTTGSTGTTLRPNFRRGGSGARASTFPFQVTPVAADPSVSNGPPRLKVEIDSWLANGLKANSKQTITGLGQPFDFVPADGGRFYVWLEADINGGGDITSVTIEHGDAPWDESGTLQTTPTGGGAPAAYPVPVAFTAGTASSPGHQAKAYQMIAYTEEVGMDNGQYANRLTIATRDGDSVHSHQIVQCVRDHLRICERCYEGFTVLLFDYHPAPCLHAPPS
jgi:hypothetical protein